MILSTIILSNMIMVLNLQTLAAKENVDLKPAASVKKSDQKQDQPASLTETPQAHWQFLHAYQSNYWVMSGGSKLGESSRNLSEEKGQWTLLSKAKIKKYLLTIKSEEKSQFRLVNDNLVTDYFYNETKLPFKSARKTEQVFDWEKNTENGYRRKDKWQRSITFPLFDRVSHLVKMRSDLLSKKTKQLSYPVSYKGKTETYIYNLVGTEQVPTGLGKIDSLKFLRVKDNGDQFFVWMAESLNYFPVKISQIEKGEADVSLVLKSLDYSQD